MSWYAERITYPKGTSLVAGLDKWLNGKWAVTNGERVVAWVVDEEYAQRVARALNFGTPTRRRRQA